MELIKAEHDLCKGCNRCVRECPMEMANITYQDEAGNIKVKIDHEKCIGCGRCISACKHNARLYADDTARFFDDLSAGVPISIIAAPSIRTNIPDWKKLFTWLKRSGVKKIYDVSLGADICIWAHVRYIESTGSVPLITQPCPVIVNYCGIYRHDLLKKLSPVHSPMACASIYMKEYENITDRIAALSPCVAKSNEFESTGLSEYNVTFAKLKEYMKEHSIDLPEEETGFDHYMSGLGSLFPMPGGLKENIEFFLGRKLSIDKAEGYNVYDKLNIYASSPASSLPEIFDVLNCDDGCNIGTACSHSANYFEINRKMDDSRKSVTTRYDNEYFIDLYKKYDNSFDLSHFMREYSPVPSQFPQITDEDIAKAFELLGKTDTEKQSVDCGACGSLSCSSMARKIALGVNIPINCIVKSMEDAKEEHEKNMAAREHLATMEKTLEADDRMRIMLNASPHIIILFDSNFMVVDCNSAACEFMGFKTKEELLTGLKEHIVNSIPEFQPDNRVSIPLTERLMTAVIEGHTKFETELHIDGNKLFLNVEMKRIPYANSFAIIAYVIDMTNVREREVELIHSREQNELQLAKLNMVVKATKIVLWDMEVVANDPVNPVNRFIWSDELRHMLGFNDENDFPNQVGSLQERLHPDDKERTIRAFSKHLLDKTGKTPYDIEYRLMKKNGEYAYYHASGETIRDEYGNPIRVAGSLMDITEVKNLIFEAERQRTAAEEANKAKSAFLSTMSHEIRTPMNAVLGITEIQLHNHMLDKSVREALEKIYASGDLLLGIINDILDLSKIEAGRLEFSIAKYQTASLISDSVQLNIMRIGSKPVEFELFIDENMPSYLLGDELRVKQILNNLLSNAFKYTVAGTVKLSVTTETISGNDDELMLVIRVNDTGQGMTEEQISKLFDEYSRFNQDANRTTEGTGLGMSITRNLIRLMNGQITIKSQPGKGSTFTVHLPQGKVDSSVLGKEMTENLHQFRTISRAQMKRVQITREPMPYGHVLIVDDVETNIYVAKGLMTPYELKIDSADSGFAAIEKIKNGKVYDIIFMDHMMPKMDGIEATRILRGMGYHQPIVALTANAVAGQADLFLESGFDDFISKPIDVRQLNYVLNKLIRDKQQPEVLEAAKKQPENKDISSSGDTSPPVIDPTIAEAFVRDATKSLAVLNTIVEKNGSYNSDDIRTYIIHTHGMKSALANIGKKDLSVVASHLEQSGRDENIELIAAETQGFISSLSAFLEEIKPKNEEPEALEEDKPFLREKLLVIKEACEEFANNTADEALAELRQKSWTHPTKELLSSISEHLLHSDFDEVIDIINKFIELY